MRIGGKDIDPYQLWGEYCEIKHEPGPFLTPTFCPNPDHPNSRTPAFQINVSKPFVHCFAHCGISGTYQHAICVIEGLYEKYNVSDDEIQLAKKKWELNESAEVRRARSKVRTAHSAAKKIIFQRAGSLARATRAKSDSAIRKRSSIKRPVAAKKVKPEAEVVTEDMLANYSYLPKEALKYLESRGINEASRHSWQIGFDEETERVTIPVRDKRGRLLFIIRRGIHKWQNPAYLYPLESPKSLLLFGACNLDRAMVRSQGLILVEGSLDTILQHQRGYRNTVGILGNHVSDTQLRLITNERPKRIYDFFDKDAGGVQAMLSTKPLKTKYPILVALYPKGERLDPASLTDEQAERAIKKAVSMDRIERKIRAARRKGAVV